MSKMSSPGLAIMVGVIADPLRMATVYYLPI